MKRGNKALVGDSAYRRYLRRPQMDQPSRSTLASSRRKHASMASSCCAPTPGRAAPGGPTMSRLAEGREPVPANRGSNTDTADLPFLRRRDTRPRILFFPHARHAEVPRRSVAPGSHRAGIEDASAPFSITCDRCTFAIRTTIRFSAPTSRSRSPICSTTPTSHSRRAPGK